MAYKTPAALEMAVKAAAKASLLDTGRAVSGFYFHRLLSLGSEGWLPDLAGPGCGRFRQTGRPFPI